MYSIVKIQSKSLGTPKSDTSESEDINKLRELR